MGQHGMWSTHSSMTGTWSLSEVLVARFSRHSRMTSGLPRMTVDRPRIRKWMISPFNSSLISVKIHLPVEITMLTVLGRKVAESKPSSFTGDVEKIPNYRK